MTYPRLETLVAHIEKAQQQSPLSASQVIVTAVSKHQPVAAIRALLAAGHRVFGENKVQEAGEKWPDLRRDFPDIELHGIGSLQTNKVKEALTLFDVIETLDRAALVDAIIKARDKMPPDQLRCRRFLIQVNTGDEPQKGGVHPEQCAELLRYCNTKNVPVEGLMCVPPLNDPPAPHFALLHMLARRHGLATLSMGMSADYEIAVRFGATHLRIGTALFGERAA